MAVKKVKATNYQPIIPDAESKLRKRVEAISSATGKKMCLFTRICGRNPVPGVRQAGDISTLLQF